MPAQPRGIHRGGNDFGPETDKGITMRPVNNVTNEIDVLRRRCFSEQYTIGYQPVGLATEGVG